MAELLQVAERAARGKHESRRLRRAGSIPAILYGHGEANVALSVPADAMSSVMRHGQRVVELTGLVSEKALIRDVQWDTYGKSVLHVDFARVSEHERVHVRVKVELRGQAPGVKNGGILQHLVHEVEIDCEALSIPDKLDLNLGELQLDGELTAANISVPDGVKLLVDPELIIVQCVPPLAEDEAPTIGGASAEPEVIGRKAAEEGEEEE